MYSGVDEFQVFLLSLTLVHIVLLLVQVKNVVDNGDAFFYFWYDCFWCNFGTKARICDFGAFLPFGL